jgi:thymidylate synthase
MNKLDLQYQLLLQSILDQGVKKEDRTGTGTISLFGRQIRHKMSEGFPLLTTKKLHFKSIVTELLWFLRGDTNIKYLVDNNCHIWTGDAYKAYRESRPLDRDAYTIKEFEEQIKINFDFAARYGELGPVYGRQWRSWGSEVPFGEATSSLDVGIDQIKNLINDLKTNPDSRRLMVNAWNVGELDQMVLPPCHYGFQVYTRELKLTERLRFIETLKLLEIFEKELSISLEINPHHNIKDFRKDFCNKHNIPTRAISLMWNQRSVDTFLGLPFNIASYGLLLEIIAKEVNMVPDELIGNLGDTHLYNNHISQAIEQINRKPFELPKLAIDQFDETNHYIGDMDDISEYNIEQFKLENYQSHPAIKAPLSN